jgi:hypothetical protein
MGMSLKSLSLFSFNMQGFKGFGKGQGFHNTLQIISSVRL